MQESWHGFKKGEHVRELGGAFNCPTGPVVSGDTDFVYIAREDGVLGGGRNGEWAIAPECAERIPNKRKQPGVFKIGERVHHAEFHSWGKILRACENPAWRNGWIVRADSDGKEKIWTVPNMTHE